MVTSIPELLHHGSGLPGLIVAMLTISLALSAVKANLPPFLGKFRFAVHDRSAMVNGSNGRKQRISADEATFGSKPEKLASVL